MEPLPDMPTVRIDVTWLSFEEALAPLIEEIAKKLEDETPRMMRYQCALWVL